MMLPGALRYGGMPALAGLCVPGELLLHNHAGTGSGNWTKAVYQAAAAPERLSRRPEAAEGGRGGDLAVITVTPGP